MKNLLAISIGGAVLTMIGFGIYTLSLQSSPSGVIMDKVDITTKENPAANPEEPILEGNITNSRYVDYSKNALDNSSNNRRVLFFYASWCPTCKSADKSFTENISSIPDNVTLIRVHYNDPEANQDEKDLAKKYAITYQHTFVQIDSSGAEVAKWNGGQIEELRSNLK
jgi:thioredoxin 1